MREEAPLYYNERHDFYALSRYDDVARELPNWQTYRSGRGTTMDIIKSGLDVPPGVILFEDPPRVALEEILKRCPEWDVDYARAAEAHTASVRAWAKLPIKTR